ncbi:MAG: adenosylcobinamide-GDP ribazoletransferase [Boseongicola sp.]|nr:adenosylcobinamide-GDP ribazoletransferase [Boseongicola sp.]
MTGFRDEMTLATGFLTRLRFPPVEYSDAAMARAVRWYSVVGIGIGISLALLFLVLIVFLPQAIAALLTVASGMLLTGALHEDGLADLADGLGGTEEKLRALEIMRDSRIGTFGILALGMTLALKISALAMLPVSVAAIAIVAGHGLGRFSMTWLMDRLPYARKKGAAAFVTATQKVDIKPAWSAALCIFAFIVVAIGIIPALATAVAFATLLSLFARWLNHRLNGYTGDALGACEQLTEAVVPLIILACL